MSQTSAGATAKPEEAKKGRRNVKRVPDGYKQVKYLLTDDEHKQLTSLAAQDDREPDDYARAQAKRHLRQSGSGSISNGTQKTLAPA